MMLSNQMRVYLLFSPLLMVMLAALPAKAEQELFIDPKLFDSEQADRIILVTYIDKHINRIPIGATNQTYRRRGEYSSSTWSRRIASSIETDYKIKILSQWPIKEIGEHCVVYLVNEDQSMTEVIDALTNDDRIDNIQAMNTFRGMTDKYNDPYYRLQTNIHSMNLAEIHSQTTGKNVTVAIVDTGVDTKHPDLKGQIQQTRNFVTQKSPDFFSDLHGTAVAGVIAAKANNEQGIVGIAPDSHVIALKACWGEAAGGLEATCNSFTLALAIDAAIEMKTDILNLSLTGPHDPLLARLIEKAIQRGIIIIASLPDRNDEKSGFPAQQPGVIGVRSLANKVEHSSENHILAVSAPGEEILTTLPKGAYDFVSGSSFAAAHVSGLASLLLQLQRSLTHQEMSRLLAKANEPAFYKLFSKDQTKNRDYKTVDEFLASL